jgi:hypothetical protein
LQPARVRLAAAIARPNNVLLTMSLPVFCCYLCCYAKPLSQFTTLSEI